MSRQVIVNLTTGAGGDNNTSFFLTPASIQGFSALAGVVTDIVSAHGTLSNLNMHGTETGVVTFTVRHNGTDSALSLTTTLGSGSFFANTVNSLVVAPGDTLYFIQDQTGGDTFRDPSWSVDFNSATDKQSMYNASLALSNAPELTGQRLIYMPFSGYFGETGAGLTTANSIMPLAGTVKNLYVYLTTGSSTSTGVTVGCALVKNGTVTSLSASTNYSGGVPVTVFNTASTVSITASDLLCWQIELTGSGKPPFINQVAVSSVIESEVNGEFAWVCGGGASNLVGASATGFMSVVGYSIGASTVDHRDAVANSCVVRRMYANFPNTATYSLNTNSCFSLAFQSFNSDTGPRGVLWGPSSTFGYNESDFVLVGPALVTIRYAKQSSLASTRPQGSIALLCVSSTGALSPNPNHVVLNNVASDAFSSGYTISSFTTYTAHNRCCSKETGEPNHAGNTGGASVWWNFNPGTGGTATIDTTQGTLNTLLAAYVGSTVSALTLVASNDNIGTGAATQSLISFAVSSGLTYRVAVDGRNGSQGDIVLNVSFEADTANTNTTWGVMSGDIFQATTSCPSIVWTNVGCP